MTGRSRTLIRRTSAFVLAGLLLGAVGFAAVRIAGRLAWSDQRTEVLLYGIDGGEWAVIDRMTARGELPHLGGLIERGVRARLRTMEPSLSPRIWTTIATGKMPEKHGVKDFFAVSSMVRSRRLWDIAEAAGWTVGLYGYPITWPPRPVAGGFLIPGWMAQGTETHPPEFEFLKKMEAASRDRRRVGIGEQIGFAIRGWMNGFRLSTLTRGAVQALAGSDDDLARYAALGTLQYRIQADVFLELHRRYRPGLSIFYSDVIDKLSHRYWLFADPSKAPPALHERYGDVVEDAYRLADAELGRVLETLDDQTAVLVVSDHGFQATDRISVSRPALLGEPVLALIDAGSALRAFKVAGRLMIRAPGAAGGPALARARAVLSSAIHEASGRPAFSLDPLPDGSFSLELNQTLQFADTDGIRVGSRRARLDSFSSRRTLGGGIHRDPGIFIMVCPTCREGEDIYELHVSDVTPTLLHQMGLPVGDDMDGRVNLDVFKREHRDARAVARVATHDEGLDVTAEDPVADERIREMLRSVGYVD